MSGERHEYIAQHESWKLLANIQFSLLDWPWAHFQAGMEIETAMTSAKLTQAEVKRLLDYDSGTGIFKWRVRTNGRIKIGDAAGTIMHSKTSKKYLKVSVNGKEYLCHRLAWIHVFGKFPDGVIDHINGNSIDNRIANLRDVSKTENQRNVKMHRSNTSGHCGVSWFKRESKWVATIGVEGKKKYLGLFDNISDAKAARKAAEIEFGFHPNHGQKGSHY